MKRILPPLRYPGSKVRISEMVASLLERNLLVGSHIYEPFAGGAGVSLNLLANKFVASATWIERDPLVFSFWKMVKDEPEALIQRMQRGKVSLAAWQRMLPLRDTLKPSKSNIAELGYAGLFFNRTCFSGVIGAGPIGGMTQNSPYKIHCRFNKTQLAKTIRECSELIQAVDIIFGDGINFLEDHALSMKTHSFVYIDPPYVTNGHKLYRYFFDEHEHERLADAVDELRTPWLMSYDNHQLIRDLYFGEQAKFVKTYQSLKGSRFVKEILLMSADLIPPARESVSQPQSERIRAEISDYEH
jgi:DNA adenine methylase